MIQYAHTSSMGKKAAIIKVAALADSIIEQQERFAKGWDKGMSRDDEPRFMGYTPRSRMQRDSDMAFALAQQYA